MPTAHICCSHTRMVTPTVDRISITIHSSYVCIRDSGKILQRGYLGDIALIHHRRRVGGMSPGRNADNGCNKARDLCNDTRASLVIPRANALLIFQHRPRHTRGGTSRYVYRGKCCGDGKRINPKTFADENTSDAKKYDPTYEDPVRFTAMVVEPLSCFHLKAVPAGRHEIYARPTNL